MKEGFLTTPPLIESPTEQWLTGNEYVAIPAIRPHDGGIESVGIVHMGAKGLIEWVGNEKQPLVKPFFWLKGEELKFSSSLEWEIAGHWVPSWHYTHGDLEFRGDILCPPDYKGCCYVLRVYNKGYAEVEVGAGLAGKWAESRLTVFSSRSLEVKQTVKYDKWSQAIILEMAAGLPLAALALGTDEEPEIAGWQPEGENTFNIGRRKYIAPGELWEVGFYIAVNQEADGAGTTLVDLRRVGWERLQVQTYRWLAERKIKLGANIKAAENNSLSNLFWRNLFFSHYYSWAKTLDSDEWVGLTSRSPRYYVSGAFWARDSFIWSYPALLLTDITMAKEVLLKLWERHMDNAGVHAHYLNGQVLYPGFELDELCAYILALEAYVNFTQDWSICEQTVIKEGMEKIITELGKCKHPDYNLFGTFLDPSDDPVDFSYLTYNNALVYRVFNFFSVLQQQRGDSAGATQWKLQANAVRDSVFHFGVVPGPFGPMFAWSFDTEGKHQLYDNPPGSLQLLAYHGFSAPEDPVFLNTLIWVNSEHNPYHYATGDYEGNGSKHASFPWVLDFANRMLAGKNPAIKEFVGLERVLRGLSQAPLDNGLACETIDPNNGQVKTGAAFAGCAGFMAVALYQVMLQAPELMTIPGRALARGDALQNFANASQGV